MAGHRKKTTLTRPEPSYDAVLADVVGLVEAARRGSARTVNALITATYWTIGHRIVGRNSTAERARTMARRWSSACRPT